MSISDWSSTAASNATTLGVNIGEGCPPSNVNDAIRKVMADVAAGINFPLLGTFLSSTTLGQARTALGVPGSTSSLTNFGNLTNTADKVPYMTGSDGWSTFDMSRLLPAGTVLPMAMNSAPNGFLKCNGAAVSRTTYATLFAAIGTTFGAGNGSTTFNVPDLRGQFVRGWADDGSTDSGRAFGSDQADALESHTHGLRVYDRADTDTLGSGGGGDNTVSSGSAYTAGYIEATGGTETRPVNVALLYVIKT